ncbi:hypothetical protein BHM03_00005962 [Ensete ventricosum]|uniref:C2H2-type domain-containing protein n=1 Tax=Ensete ventricosum TaxID=4639 RepID=A0A445MBF1_ENSVE|nr:hypothetical protein BHM03_00005962 [Ensete ventricosum]
MDRAGYRLWLGTEQSNRPRLIVQIPAGLVVGSSIKEPWEEEAYSWPPRSYSCSFCRREFRSAQALGGHMNVHRRDRARLKQLYAGYGGEAMEEDEQHPNPSTVTSAGRHQPQVNPGSAAVLPSTPSHRVVYAPSTHEHWSETNFFSPSFSSSITGDNLKESLFSKTRSLLIVYDEKTNRNKRRRTDPLPAFFVRSSSCDQQQEVQTEVLNHSFDEELDLELRLGGAPK